MWNYEKRLEYPVNITTPNPKIAQIIMSPVRWYSDGEMGASMRVSLFSVSQHRTEL